MEISWLKKPDDFKSGGTKVGDYIYRIFRHEYTVNKVIMKFDVSIERYVIIAIDERTVTISETGRKSDGTFGYRKYSRSTGMCLDDNIPPSNKSRRKIKQF